MSHTELPSVCIVGRPNVGKSTLFNRMIGKRMAVVHQTSGTTRDSIEGIYKKGTDAFRLIDTGGFLKNSKDKISSLVKKQIEEYIRESDILLFLCDVKSGPVALDEDVVSILRKSSKKVFLLVNKVDSRLLEEDVYDFYQLGLGSPYPISAMHNRGIDAVVKDLLKIIGTTDHQDEPIASKIAITGRPNVGKSYFLNTLLKKERVIVDTTPGTTRDPIDTYFKKDGKLFILIDTAGMRHKRKVKDAVDVYSMSRSREAIERSDVSFLLIDGYDGLRNDDVRIFNYITDAGKCCIIVVNKWDLVRNIQMAAYKDAILRKTPSMIDYPIIFASAKTARNVLSCVDMVKYVTDSADRRIETGELNKFFMYIKSSAIRVGKRRPPKISYIVQTGTRPPSFLIFVNDPKLVSEDYSNFIKRNLRKRYNFYGTPIKIIYRRKK